MRLIDPRIGILTAFVYCTKEAAIRWGTRGGRGSLGTGRLESLLWDGGSSRLLNAWGEGGEDPRSPVTSMPITHMPPNPHNKPAFFNRGFLFRYRPAPPIRTSYRPENNELPGSQPSPDPGAAFGEVVKRRTEDVARTQKSRKKPAEKG